MKKLLVLVIVLVSFSMYAHSQVPPTINDAKVEFYENSTGVYWIDYSQFVEQGTFCIHWGSGYIDLNTWTLNRDKMIQTSEYTVKSYVNSSLLAFIPVEPFLHGSTTKYEFTYTVFDGVGNMSNEGKIGVIIDWD